MTSDSSGFNAELTTEATRLRYADLPEGNAHGVFGESDRLGCLNLLTPERTLQAAQNVRTGRSFSLNAPLADYNQPTFFQCYTESETGWPEGWDRSSPKHVVVEFPGGMGHDDRLDNFYMQAGTQWDHFWHCGDSRTRTFYNSLTDLDEGIERWAERGITGRGVLLDVATWSVASGRPFDWRSDYGISAADLENCAAWQQVEVLPGTILLLRTGWQRGYSCLDDTGRKEYAASRPTSPGLEASREVAARLWDWGIAAAAGDNPALERWPLGNRPLHEDLLGQLGIPIGELWLLDELAAACREIHHYDVLVTSAPLNLKGGVGSPANAIAIL